MTLSQEKSDVLRKAVETFGKKQITKTFEEMAELQKELCKNVLNNDDNVDKIIEEIADVKIMLAQIKILFDISNDDVDKVLYKKIDRLQRLLEG